MAMMGGRRNTPRGQMSMGKGGPAIQMMEGGERFVCALCVSVWVCFWVLFVFALLFVSLFIWASSLALRATAAAPALDPIRKNARGLCYCCTADEQRAPHAIFLSRDSRTAMSICVGVKAFEARLGRKYEFPRSSITSYIRTKYMERPGVQSLFLSLSLALCPLLFCAFRYWLGFCYIKMRAKHVVIRYQHSCPGKRQLQFLSGAHRGSCKWVLAQQCKRASVRVAIRDAGGMPAEETPTPSLIAPPLRMQRNLASPWLSEVAV